MLLGCLWSPLLMAGLHREQVNSTRWSSNCTGQISNAKDGLPDFNDSKAAFQAKSTLQLLQSLAVFTACTSKPFISNADKVFDISKRVLSRALVTSVVKNTFFKHFCAGDFPGQTCRLWIQFAIAAILEFFT